METSITWTDDAWEHYKACTARTAELTSHYGGATGYEYAANFHTQLQNVTFAAGPVHIGKDGEGFIISTRHIVIGLIWTPDTNGKMIDRLRANGVPLTRNEIWPNWPRTGTWSAHS